MTRPIFDAYVGRRITTCGWCRGTGRRYADECDGCGGTGKRRECLRADCEEYGCGGYGSCHVNAKPANPTYREGREG